MTQYSRFENIVFSGHSPVPSDVHHPKAGWWEFIGLPLEWGERAALLEELDRHLAQSGTGRHAWYKLSTRGGRARLLLPLAARGRIPDFWYARPPDRLQVVGRYGDWVIGLPARPDAPGAARVLASAKGRDVFRRPERPPDGVVTGIFWWSDVWYVRQSKIIQL